MGDGVTQELWSTKAERNALITQWAIDGMTQQEIGDRVGLSRERVRQILESNAGPSGTEMRRIRRKRAEARVLEMIREQEMSSAAEVAAATGVSEAMTRDILRGNRGLLSHAGGGQSQQFTSDDLLNSLRQAASVLGEPLSQSKYKSWRKSPSASVIVARFTSWNRACRTAGVEPQEAKRSYEQQFDDDEILEWLRSYLIAPRSAGTMSGYDEWRHRSGFTAPSAATIRVRFGSWATAKSAALERERRLR